jgi:hypothetical protein
MTSSENISASNRSVYDTCDADYLRQLREASGVEETWLARTACLSLAQVRQLEEGGEGLFYSPTIKRQAYKRLLMILGAEPPTLIAHESTVSEPSAVNDLNEIIAMGEKNLARTSVGDFFQTVRSRVSQHQAYVVIVSIIGVTALASLLMPLPGSNVEETVVAKPAPTKTSESLTLAALPEREASAVEPVVPAVSVAVIPATTSATVPASAACEFTRDVLPQISPLTATKPSRYVYMVAAADVSVCVVDGNQQASLLKLKAGESHSVFGVAPWQVSSAKLGNLQIYFQGSRVALPEGVDQRIALIEKSN